ncbi:hypothetical protein P5673_029967 [Acropora cervicornis]|uniref:Parvovirus non-structural protein 1 helicase domain-containing protein n=1 Tax=Acropora cervicornis TaxID=6130 RepID=A0AAD9PV10_ACRCE|nr:hypothetical protein P5673_029967 [Acropora cervicornis]
MDFLKEYGSSESSSTDNEDDISRDSAEGLSSNLNDRAVRQVKEAHQVNGFHYHMALKLNRCKRWLSSKWYLEENHGISVHFSNIHHNYYSAWKYTTKKDRYVMESKHRPDLWDSKPPKTQSASISRKHKVVENEDDEPSNYSSDNNDDISSEGLYSALKGVKSRTELLAYANEQKLTGKSDIAEFIVNQGPRVVSEGQCASGCNGEWLTCASEVLEQNGIRREAFATVIRELLEKGRSKFRNIMICGPANSGKTFLLNPLTSIYDTFSNPASTSFAWVGAEDAECIFLNDFRWSQQVIQWHDFLLMLEGQVVHLPAPKTHYAKDIVFEKDTPIFCTGKQPFIYIKNGVIDQRETEMMPVRWKIFQFNVQIN